MKTEFCGYHHWAHAEQNISISSLAPYNKTECLTTYTEETSHTTNNLTKKNTQPQQSCHTHWKKRKEQQPHLCSAISDDDYSSNHSAVTQGTSTTNEQNLTDQPHNHPRMLGHENSPCEWVTSHHSEDMGYVVSSMGVFGDACTNNNELKSCSETQSNTTEPHPTSCKLQRDGSTCSSYELLTNLCSINLAPHNTPTVVPNDDTHTIPFTLTAGASVKRGIFVPFL